MEKVRNLVQVCDDIINAMIDVYSDDVDAILELLVSNKPKVISSWKGFDSCINDLDDVSFFRKSVMLALWEKALVVINYNSILQQGLANTDYNIFAKLLDYGNEDIIKLFLNRDPLIKKIIDYALDYYLNNYIYQSVSKQNVFDQLIYFIVTQVNPAAIFNYVNRGELLEYEKKIHLFFNLTNDATNSSSDPFHSVTKNINDYFDGNQKRIDEFLRYIMAHLYESLTVLMEQFDFFTSYSPIVEFIDANTVDDAIYRFKHDRSFQYLCIEAFRDINSRIDEDDLTIRRDAFKEIGNIDKLKLMDPYFDQEEENFQRKKQQKAQF